MMKLIAMAAVALPLFTAGFAAAGEPMRLTDGQMDGVTAGGSALALADAEAIGSLAITAAATLAKVYVVDNYSSEVTSINWVASLSEAGAEAFAQ